MKKTFITTILLIAHVILFSQAKKPSLMIVPADDWCMKNNYSQEIDNQGVKQIISDYNKAILNSELMNVITKVNGLMAERGFPLKDLSASLMSLQNQSAEDAMLMGKEGAEINETPIDKLKAVAKADIIMQIYWEVNELGFEKSVTFRLRAIDAYTDKQIASASGTGNPSMSGESAVLIEEAILDHIDNFNSTLQNHFDDMFENGREVILRIKTWDTWDYDLETEEFGDDELGILIEDWVSDNTMKGRFSTSDATETMMLFEQVRIPLYYERNGQQRALDCRRWAKGLKKYLSSEFEIDSKLMMKGLGQAQLIIGGK
jgi:hypothetical protein